jgi:hypothetical protein
MLYLVPVLTVSMLAFMAWKIGFRMRRDRISIERERRRGQVGFRPKERLRFLLRTAFPPVEDKAEWEEPLVASLARIDAAAVPEQPARASADKAASAEPASPAP